MIYAFVDSNSYVVFTTSSPQYPEPIPDLTIVELQQDIGNCPAQGYRYSITTNSWVDARTDQQKYNDAASEILKTRNVYLYSSDWTQIPNNPLTTQKQEQWAVYRQQLRDITTQSGYPFNVVWPTQPE